METKPTQDQGEISAEVCELYVLRDPLTGKIRYAGKANNSKKRLASHIRDSRRRDYPVYRWIRKLAANHLVPMVEVVKQTANWRTDEKELIAVLRAREEPLLNVADGGDEPHCPIEIRRANGGKLSKHLADPISRRVWEIKRQIARGLRNGEITNETRAKLRYAAWKHSDLFGVWLNIPDRVEP